MATKKHAVSGPRVMNINNWESEWVEALSAYLKIKAVPMKGTIFATGMGGSGIVGEVLKHITNKNIKFSKLPIKEKVDWVLAISYSGNTTETIYSVKQMRKRGAKVVAITSGGKLPEYADYVVKLPVGMLPRDGFPYMLSAALAVVGCKKELREAIKAVKLTNLGQAKKIVELIKGRTPVIYSSGWMIAAAKRFKQQLNENAKMFAFFSKMPDSFHNDIEPFFWDNKPFSAKRKEGFVPVIIGNGYLAYKTAQFLPNAFHIKAKKTNKVLEVVSSIYLLDYVSFKLAEERKADRISIPGITMGRQVISGLKSFHTKVG
ncbi:MAG: SIS domain-containing protein [Candidatus Micrarchaeota archaeon]|nr:SIS domain-containing protein [Candidatus Micrarchaeota archaeon]